jgi:hypothetical protein
MLALVGLLDLGQVQVQQLVQRLDRRHQRIAVTLPPPPQRADQTVAQAGQRNVGGDLVEADLDVAQADPPASH